MEELEQAVPAYEPPEVTDLGTLVEITGAAGTGVKNEGASVKT
jgi:hypothetical protein